MPYANLNEAFDDFTDTFSSNSSSNETADLRNPNYYNRATGHASVGTRYGQLGGGQTQQQQPPDNTVRRGELAGAPFDRVNNNIRMMQSTFDLSDDVPEIAANYIPDKYNVKYSGSDDWDVIDPDIRGVTAPRNPGLVASPDRIISPVTQQRTVIDKLWERPVSADIDTFQINRRNEARANDHYGGIGTAPGPTQHMIRAPTFQENMATPTPTNTGSSGNSTNTGSGSVSTQPNKGTCSSQECLDMFEKIMGCEECVKKLRRLLGIQDRSNDNWFDLSEVNVSKLVFWVIVIILIVAVYELLNTIMARIRG
jgi:hypothetical protein